MEIPYRQLVNVEKLAECKDSALSYINCDDWLQYMPSDKNYFGTIVVVDDGLSVKQWKDLERRSYSPDSGYLDIIGVLTPDANGKPKLYTDPNSVTDADLGYTGDFHGYRVLSALMTIARGAKVIFVDASLNGHGFDMGKHEVWKWIYDNRSTYDIDIINFSWSVGAAKRVEDKDQEVVQYIDLLYAAGVFMVGAMGNDGQNTNFRYLTYHQHIYGVGSIYHENRGGFRQGTKKIWGFLYTYWYWDDD